MIVIYHVLIYRYSRENYLRSVGIGYSWYLFFLIQSSVVFGWMTILSQLSSTSSLNFFGYSIPLNLAPFGSLIFTSIIIPKASFVVNDTSSIDPQGHLSGILVGYLIAFSEQLQFVWFTDFLFWNSLLWWIIITVASLKMFSGVNLWWIQMEDDPSSQFFLQNGFVLLLTDQSIITRRETIV